MRTLGHDARRKQIPCGNGNKSAASASNGLRDVSLISRIGTSSNSSRRPGSIGHPLSWFLALVFSVLTLHSYTAQAQAPLVLKLTIHSTIQPIAAGYLHRGLLEAEHRHAALVLISLDTPGGLLTSTRAMVRDIEQSPIPVAVYVSPTGARAGSAGFFLLESADLAAMAPGTNAGAAHPVDGTGKNINSDMRAKVENDAAAFLRASVLHRARNAEAAEAAVRQSKSSSDSEALSLHLIEVIAPDDRALLQAISGVALHRFDGSFAHLDLTNATIIELPPSFRERTLTALTDPNLAVLLLIAGFLLIYLEANMPGTIIPGALGATLVLLAIFGLGLLPVRHTAIGLLLAALLLLIAELKVPSHGVLAGTGILALMFGFATLVDGPIDELQVHGSTAIACGLGFGLISFFLARLALRARRNKILLGPDAIIGRAALAMTPLDPAGQVEVHGEIWQATLDSGLSLPAGASVIVRHADKLVLFVDPAQTP